MGRGQARSATSQCTYRLDLFFNRHDNAGCNCVVIEKNYRFDLHGRVWMFLAFILFKKHGAHEHGPEEAVELAGNEFRILSLSSSVSIALTHSFSRSCRCALFCSESRTRSASSIEIKQDSPPATFICPPAVVVVLCSSSLSAPRACCSHCVPRSLRACSSSTNCKRTAAGRHKQGARAREKNLRRTPKASLLLSSPAPSRDLGEIDKREMRSAGLARSAPRLRDAHENRRPEEPSLASNERL